jgi:hypothetical protein
VGGDSCILQWALPASLAAKLQAAAAQQGHKPVPTQQQQVQQQHKPAPDIKVLVEEHGVVCEASTTPRAVKKENGRHVGDDALHEFCNRNGALFFLLPAIFSNVQHSMNSYTALGLVGNA